MDNKKRRLLFFVLIMGVLFITGCATDRKGVGEPSISEYSGEVKEFTMSAFSFGFDPVTIDVNEGDLVKINLINKDIIHTLTIDELDVNVPLQTGETKTIEFVASKKGTFEFYCAIPGHKKSGMKGKINIT